MSESVLDASSILTLLFCKPGHESVMKKLSGAIVSTVSQAEVIAALIDGGATIEESRTMILSLPFEFVSFSPEEAVIAARYRSMNGFSHLAFEKLASLALATSRGLPMVTTSHDLPPEIPGVYVENDRESSHA